MAIFVVVVVVVVRVDVCLEGSDREEVVMLEMRVRDERVGVCFFFNCLRMLEGWLSLSSSSSGGISGMPGRTWACRAGRTWRVALEGVR